MAVLLLADLRRRLRPGRAHGHRRTVTATSHLAAVIPPPPKLVHLTTRPSLPDTTFTLDGVALHDGRRRHRHHPDHRARPTSTNASRSCRSSPIPLTKAHFDHFEFPPAADNVREVVAVFDVSRFLHLTTIPLLPNTTFSLDGVAYTTGADGTVTIATTALINLDQRLKLRLRRPPIPSPRRRSSASRPHPRRATGAKPSPSSTCPVPCASASPTRAGRRSPRPRDLDDDQELDG